MGGGQKADKHTRSKEMIRKFSFLVMLLNLTLLLFTVETQSAESQLWRDFVNGNRAKLPDFSYAGYNRGETRIPDVNWQVYNVVDYGANPSPNTPGSKDLNAIKKALRAVPADQGGVIFFPEGIYDIGNSSSQSADNVIHFKRGRIVWKGEGKDK